MAHPEVKHGHRRALVAKGFQATVECLNHGDFADQDAFHEDVVDEFALKAIRIDAEATEPVIERFAQVGTGVKTVDQHTIDIEDHGARHACIPFLNGYLMPLPSSGSPAKRGMMWRCVWNTFCPPTAPTFQPRV